MSAYVTLDIARCRNAGHRFETAGSDKTPMKLSLVCQTCSGNYGKTAYVAFGEDTLSWGAWQKRRRKDSQQYGEGHDV